MVKGYNAERYPVTVRVRVRWLGVIQDEFEDEIKGLNVGHALWRARNNWPDADEIEPVVVAENALR